MRSISTDQQIANLRAALLQRNCSESYVNEIQDGTLWESARSTPTPAVSEKQQWFNTIRQIICGPWSSKDSGAKQ